MLLVRRAALHRLAHGARSSRTIRAILLRSTRPVSDRKCCRSNCRAYIQREKVGVSVFAPLSDITPGALRPPPWATTGNSTVTLR